MTEGRNIVSISPTFFEHLFHTKVFWAAFLFLLFSFVLFWRKEIGAKDACKMLVKWQRWAGLSDVLLQFDWEKKTKRKFVRPYLNCWACVVCCCDNPDWISKIKTKVFKFSFLHKYCDKNSLAARRVEYFRSRKSDFVKSVEKKTCFEFPSYPYEQLAGEDASNKVCCGWRRSCW